MRNVFLSDQAGKTSRNFQTPTLVLQLSRRFVVGVLALEPTCLDLLVILGVGTASATMRPGDPEGPSWVVQPVFQGIGGRLRDACQDPHGTRVPGCRLRGVWGSVVSEKLLTGRFQPASACLQQVSDLGAPGGQFCSFGFKLWTQHASAPKQKAGRLAGKRTTER